MNSSSAPLWHGKHGCWFGRTARTNRRLPHAFYKPPLRFARWNRILINPILNTLTGFVQSTSASLAKHPRRVMGAIGVLLLGTGVTAFGIAPLAPDAAKLPVSQVVESLTLEPFVPNTLAAVPLTLFRSDTVRRDDTAQSLLQRLGVNDTAAQNFLRTHPTARQLFSRSSKLVHAETTDRGELLRLTARWLPDEGRTFNRLVIEKQASGLIARLEKGELTASARLVSGTIHSSLFAATDAVNLPDNVAGQLAEIFGSEIDFRRDLRQGDRFSLVYESLEADGETLRAGRVLSAEFINNGREYEAVWFDGEGKQGAYYGFDGQSSRKFFLTSPLEFSRVSSGYGMRFHPISGQRKAHLGVDYAAPTGTPVRTIGEGVVTFAGWQRGYGNVIQIQHKDNQSTLYAHLSRIDVARGQRVEQGVRIGAVGSTGASTGPHLHFEFRVSNMPQDPLAVARQSESISISPTLRARFDAVAQAQRQKLDAAATLQQASAE